MAQPAANEADAAANAVALSVPAASALVPVRALTREDGTVVVYRYRELTYPSSDRYLGETVDGLRSGRGRCTYGNGDVYEGEWESDEYHGHGKLQSRRFARPAGSVTHADEFVGAWRHGRRHGHGTWRVYALVGETSCVCECLYEGAWVDGQREGHGSQTRGLERYVGEWHMGRFHGRGQLTLPSRDAYDGGFYLGAFHGDGVYTYGTTGGGASGSKPSGSGSSALVLGSSTTSLTAWYSSERRAGAGYYMGGWRHGKRHGVGKRAWASGSEYEGEWAEDGMHGRGIYRSERGDMYIGEFQDSRFHGEGTLVLFTGERYQGQFMRGVPCGRGKHSFAHGGFYEGEFKAELRCGVTQSKRALRLMQVAEKIREWDCDVVPVDKDPWTHAMQIYFGRELRRVVQTAGGPMTQAAHMLIGSAEDAQWCKDHPVRKAATRGSYACDGKRHGRGLRVWADGAQYEGDWVQDAMHGNGAFRAASGSTYVGAWKDNVPHGRGRATFCGGGDNFVCPAGHRHDGHGHCTYDGEWYRGTFHGVGAFTCADGRSFTGGWRAGKRHGRGVLVDVPEHVCEALRRGERLDAQGRRWTVDYWSPAVHEGEFNDGERHGIARVTLVNGDVLEGSMLRGRWEGIVRLTMRGYAPIFGLYEHGHRVAWTDPTTEQVLQMEHELVVAAEQRARAAAASQRQLAPPRIADAAGRQLNKLRRIPDDGRRPRLLEDAQGSAPRARHRSGGQ